MENTTGVYVMQVASTLSGMHPQTLRKYERAGLLKPLRNNSLRMYSDEDIRRLRMIKHLVDRRKLNLAGVELALKLRSKLLNMKKELTSVSIAYNREERLVRLLDELLEVVGTG